MDSTTDLNCNICQKTFLAQIFSAHQRLHSQDKFHPCNLCGIVLTTRDDLYEHNDYSCDLTIKDQVKKPYSCEICKKTFTQSLVLTIHKRSCSSAVNSQYIFLYIFIYRYQWFGDAD